ncbi:MAG: DUF4418 family protein [Chloroflexota bacterium]|nr:MAG: DUF4418 family protein [Chloroflexota bacterium]
MKKLMGVLLVVLALVVGIVPLFTDCLSQGRALTTTDGKTVPMKCHWTAIAEIGAAIPLGLVGIFNITSKRKETFSTLSLLGMGLGALIIAFPTVLIGVCANPSMICNMIMKPTLIAAGTLAIAASLVVFVISVRMDRGQANIAQAAG